MWPPLAPPCPPRRQGRLGRAEGEVSAAEAFPRRGPEPCPSPAARPAPLPAGKAAGRGGVGGSGLPGAVRSGDSSSIRRRSGRSGRHLRRRRAPGARIQERRQPGPQARTAGRAPRVGTSRARSLKLLPCLLFGPPGISPARAPSPRPPARSRTRGLRASPGSSSFPPLLCMAKERCLTRHNVGSESSYFLPFSEAASSDLFAL